jgi:phosphoglycolate phosphatase-like HAD superfamily hydrolase
MKKKENAKIALFDCDKTLVEISNITNKALSDALNSQFKVRGDLSMLDRDKYCGVDIVEVILNVLEKTYKKKKKTTAIEDINLSKFILCKDTYENGLVKRLRNTYNPRKLLTDGASKFLATLNTAHTPVGVYTGGLDLVVRTALRVTDIRRYVDVFTAGKNRMDAVKKCVSGLEDKYKIRIKPKTVAIFGDSPNDMETALSYGAIPIGILGASEYSGKELQKAGARHVYDSFNFYKTIMLEIFNKRI